jgi:hypothetical protein
MAKQSPSRDRERSYDAMRGGIDKVAERLVRAGMTREKADRLAAESVRQEEQSKKP